MTVRSSKPDPVPSLNFRHSPSKTPMSQEEKVVVGSVARRPNSEVVVEMAAIAVEERRRMTTPAPPTPVYPGRFMYSHRRPRPLHRPLNPAPPEHAFQVAAVRTSWDRDERERFLLEAAEEAARRPRTPTPPRQPDDFYDLARWSVRRWR